VKPDCRIDNEGGTDVEKMMTLISLRLRKVLTSILLLAFLVPTFASVISQPSLSAEQKLLRDLGFQICSQTQPHKEKNNNQDHQTCCILCTPQGSALEASFDTAQSHKSDATFKTIKPLTAIKQFSQGPPLRRANFPQGPPQLLAKL
jgi:hypothetical protein